MDRLGQGNRGKSGLGTLSSLVSIKADAELDVAELKQLLQRVQRTIHRSPNAVRPWDRRT